MIILKQNLTKKEKENIYILLQELTDSYNDFYITRQNLRLYLKDNIDLLYNCLKKGDKIVFNENGLIFIYGYSDNAIRKYLKILTRDNESTEKLLKMITWKIKKELWIKIKANNPIKNILENNGFYLYAFRGKEILLRKKAQNMTEKETDNASHYKN